MADLNEFIAQGRTNLQQTTADHPERWRRLQHLSVWLFNRFSQTKSLSDLEEAIQLSRQSLEIAGKDHPKRAPLMCHLALLLNGRYEATNVTRNLDEVIQLSQEAAGADESDVTNQLTALSVLANSLHERYRVKGNESDLDNAIQVHQRALNTIGDNDPRLPVLLCNMAISLNDRFLETNNSADLECLTIVTQKAVACASQETRGKSKNLHACSLKNKFHLTDDLDDIEKAIEMVKSAIEVTPKDDIELPVYLNNLGVMLGLRSEKRGDLTDAEEAVRRSQQAVDMTPKDDLEMSKRLQDLTYWRTHRDSLLERESGVRQALLGLFKVDLDMIATLQSLDNEELRAFVELNDRNDSNDEEIELSICSSYLLWELLHTIDDLHVAICRLQAWINETPVDQQDRSRRFEIFNALVAEEIRLSFKGTDVSARGDIFVWLDNLYENFFLKDDINTASAAATSELQKIGLHEVMRDNKHLSMALNQEALSLDDTINDTGNSGDLEKVFRYHALSLESAPKGSTQHLGATYNVALQLARKGESTGTLAYIDAAIEFHTIVTQQSSPEDPFYCLYLQALGSAFRLHFELTGSLDDLNKSVETCSKAVESSSAGHLGRSACLGALSNAFGRRFQILGSLEDIKSAVYYGKASAQVSDKGAYMAWTNLSSWLADLSERSGSSEDLQEAVSAAHKAIDLCPAAATERHQPYANLGRCHLFRFQRTGKLCALDEGIEATSKAIELAPNTSPQREYWLSNLGIMYLKRFEESPSAEDIDRAIETLKSALKTASYTSRHWTSLCYNLGQCYRLRSDSIEDQDAALTSYTDAFNNNLGRPLERILSAQRASDIMILRKDWKQAHFLLKAAVKLLGLVSPRALAHVDKQHLLRQFSGLASTAAAVCLNVGVEPVEALQLLEAGRGIITTQLLEMRSDVTDLEEQYPDLAARFIALRSLLDAPNDHSVSIDHASPPSSTTSLHLKAETELGQLLEDIRSKPDFQQFLLPPSQEELASVAKTGHVAVVNLSSVRSDAFIISSSGVALVQLEKLQMVDVKHWVSYITRSSKTGQMLQWLWDTICCPILDAIGMQNPPGENERPRLWWVPTGLLTRFPLHAAGYHELRSGMTVLDRVISSYASSVRPSRHRRKEVTHTLQKDRVLVASMQNTPGLSGGTLPFVVNETETLTKLWSTGKAKLELFNVSPRKSEVLGHLSGCKVFHFAGHGSSNASEPSKSCLLLEDWQTDPLTVGDLRDHSFQDNPPFLGYLSACSTSANKVDDLLDEGIHLVGALQLAGFRNVIGTLWQVSDLRCVDVARVFYETIDEEGFTDTAVCRGLNRALLQVRDLEISESKSARDVILVSEDAEDNSSNWHWVPFVHHGSL
ncbi:hypothetical protein FIE12Z_2898 [Fusarium flagelliforme]|uniref:CHAT domain-containing protein n=1 Tax=Fusarium flagelliforme TaxID=2675880 RepID=A0A395MYZ1_9HYPO|nr:hypothetical protein FIE12Z_2898 [Fusarium flagelliforme]